MTTDEVMNNWMKIIYPNQTIIEVNTDKIPADMKEFLIWLVKNKTEFEFIFNFRNFNLHVNNIKNELIFTVIPTQIKSREYIKSETRIQYKNDDYAFWVEIVSAKFKPTAKTALYIDDVEDEYFDETMRDTYSSAIEAGYILKNYKESKKKLLNKLLSIGDIFNLDGETKVTNIKQQIPEKYQDDYYYKQTEIEIYMDLYNLSNKDKSTLLLNIDDKKLRIKMFLNEYLDLSLFVMNIKNINLIYTLGDTPNKLNIHMEYEVLYLEDYYDTIGRYKLLLKNVCGGGQFKFDEVIKIAKDLSIDVSILSSNEICDVLTRDVYNLKAEDFDFNSLPTKSK